MRDSELERLTTPEQRKQFIASGLEPKPLPALPSYSRSTIRNSFLPVFDPAWNFNGEAPRINAKGPDGPDRSQAVSDAPQEPERREKIHPVADPDGQRVARTVADIREARRERAGLPHHVKAGDPNRIPPVVESLELQIGSIHFARPLGPDDPVPVTHLADGRVRLDATPGMIEAAAKRASPGEFHSRDQLFFQRLEDGRVRVRKGVAETVLEPETWASAVAAVSARGSEGTAYTDAFEVHMVNPYGTWKGEELLHRPRPGEASVVLASLSDDVERIKACREPKIHSPDPQCSGPGYAHKPHGNCMGYGTDRT